MGLRLSLQSTFTADIISWESLQGSVKLRMCVGGVGRRNPEPQKEERCWREIRTREQSLFLESPAAPLPLSD